ncbi:tetraprenyl-beta-curcumene synthase family protein [Paenibacillus albiflavus]|uniref:Tetraprenyl-beta-curcumene synthase family protein n=1 Tax=Paenibacillus albiflavus TaxID=2545760 RepID=A0A4R4E433_9BACL|nr:tetraprenyl-beta-curcumene synthase family protein [Paenibacillus albiflavus]TCZ74316.1 tetraprenyl-beta-curcumene synthase family protein [Paenibacillus albiflavus]
MRRVYRYVFPEVKEQLQGWLTAAERIPDPELRKQAIDSITHKEFHCQGGAIYASANLPMRGYLIPLIVAFQTISDYLDNLCDRSTSLDPEDFRLLHQSMLDAINPEAALVNYYALRKEQDDGGYLHDLVTTCQACIRELPSYKLTEQSVRNFVSLYIDLQVYKHINIELREKALINWWNEHKADFPQLSWNEFASATGSTLGVFMMFLAACDPDLPEAEIERINEAYFPYVGGLHILLDYLIDQEEDRLGGDLNFCTYFNSMSETTERIAFMARNARDKILYLEHPKFHRMIIEGLLALYLSDPKVRRQPEVKHISRKLMQKSPLTRLFFFINSLWIRAKSDPITTQD